MDDSQRSNSSDVSGLIKSLQSITTLMGNLVVDLRDQATSLAVVKTKIEDISSKVDSLMHVVLEGNGSKSIVTRLALVEQSIKDVEDAAEDIKEANANAVSEVRRMVEQDKADDKRDIDDDKKSKRERSVARWQTLGAAIAGFSALALQIYFALHK